MLIAKQKRKENIAEYILYLFQVEDLIRAFNLDAGLIQQQLISRYETDEITSPQITEWYLNLARMMEKEGIQKTGHLQFLTNIINELNEFHLTLIKTELDKMYVQVFRSTAGILSELRQKNKTTDNDIQLALDTIYGYLLLKIQKKEISGETTGAIKQLSGWLGLLSKLYKDFEAGELDLQFI